MQTQYPEEEKVRLVRLYERGISVKQICREHHLARSTLYYWIYLYKKLISAKKAVTCHRKVFLLEKHVAYLTRRNDIFTESECSAGSPLAEKLDAIARMKDRYNIRVLCETLQVRRSTVYHYFNRKPEKTQNMQQDEHLMPVIKEIFEQSKARIGAKKIRVILAKSGIATSARRISRLMKDMSLVCAAPNVKRSYPKEKARQYSRNVLNRQFNQIAPNRAWVGDITYVISNGERYYVCVVIDLFSRKVLAHEVSTSMPATFVSSTFLKAYVRRDCPKSLVFHSDQGAQYTSYTFGTLLDELKVTQSLSKPGCPYDNAVVESFFSTMKKEEIKRNDYDSLSALRYAVNEYINFYNGYRPHQSLSYATPNMMDEQYFQNEPVTD